MADSFWTSQETSTPSFHANWICAKDEDFDWVTSLMKWAEASNEISVPTAVSFFPPPKVETCSDAGNDWPIFRQLRRYPKEGNPRRPCSHKHNFFGCRKNIWEQRRARHFSALHTQIFHLVQLKASKLWEIKGQEAIHWLLDCSQVDMASFLIDQSCVQNTVLSWSNLV